MLVARVAGVTTREAAAALTGVEIFARRDQLPTPSEDEFYYDDLVGLDAFDAAGRRLGAIASVSNYGAGDILEIAPEGGGETLLLPFTKGIAPTIDFDAGRIVIEPPHEVEDEGLADIRSIAPRERWLLRARRADRYVSRHNRSAPTLAIAVRGGALK